MSLERTPNVEKEDYEQEGETLEELMALFYGAPKTRGIKKAFCELYIMRAVKGQAAREAGTNHERILFYERNDPHFRKAVALCKELAADLIQVEARRRAVEGWQEPVVFKGELQYERDPDTKEVRRDSEGKPIPLMVRKYSDRLLETLLSGLRRETFGRQTDVNVAVEVSSPQQPAIRYADLSPEQRIAYRALLSAPAAEPVPAPIDAEFKEVEANDEWG